jgi:hypothetical protein
MLMADDTLIGMSSRVSPDGGRKSLLPHLTGVILPVDSRRTAH